MVSILKSTWQKTGVLLLAYPNHLHLLSILKYLSFIVIKDLEAKHREELEKIQRKVNWYMENQELLDKSTAKLRAKEDEIHKLQMRLEDFKSEVIILKIS